MIELTDEQRDDLEALREREDLRASEHAERILDAANGD